MEKIVVTVEVFKKSGKWYDTMELILDCHISTPLFEVWDILRARKMSRLDPSGSFIWHVKTNHEHDHPKLIL